LYKNSEILATTKNQKGLFIIGITQNPFQMNAEFRKLFEKYLIEV